MKVTVIQAQSFFLKVKQAFAHPARLPLGEVLRRRKIITADQLRRALNEQDDRLRHLDQSVKLGMILVEQGYVSEDALLRAINEHYGLSLGSIADDLESRLKIPRTELRPRPAGLQIPLWLQLSVATTLIIVLTIFLLNFFILNRQKERLYRQTIRVGAVSLKYFEANARIPLLEDDLVQLNTLIKSVAEVDGLVYAIIVDNDGNIKAHSDMDQIGKRFAGFELGDTLRREGEMTYFDYYLPSGEHVLNLTRPIAFKEKKLGEAHVGVSIDFIEKDVRHERSGIIAITAAVILFGIAIAVFFGFRFSRPIARLVCATREIGKGNYQHRIELARRDELGNLAAAFNHMNQELWMKSLMQESFGKYVGAHILNMILENPERSWLKGRRQEATILFCDIRGFTSYSESKEPEAIVDQLNEYFEIASSAILRHGGYVDKFMGDAVLGVFGVPVQRQGHVMGAVRAAFDMQQVFRQRLTNGNCMLGCVGIGIDSGIVVSGNIGSAVKMEYTVIGDSVNLASRLCEIAGAGEIIVSKTIYEKVCGLVETEVLRPQLMKGRSEPVEAYKVVKLLEVHDGSPN
jgi:adenylate cyclase